MKFFHFAAMMLLSAAFIVPATASIVTGSAHAFPMAAPAAGWLQIDQPEPATFLLLGISIILLAIAGRAQQLAAQ
jgi:hypothetical protein